MDAVRFDELNINDKILKAVKEMGFEAASPIQGAAIPVVLEGSNISLVRHRQEPERPLHLEYRFWKRWIQR